VIAASTLDSKKKYNEVDYYRYKAFYILIIDTKKLEIINSIQLDLTPEEIESL